MKVSNEHKPVNILLVEDNPADMRLMQEAFKEGKVRKNLITVRDGVEAMSYLRKEGRYIDAVQPDLIMLDLNLPKKDGREVLEEIKSDERLKLIPVVVLTTSESEQDICKMHALHANCYIIKPVDFEQFIKVVRAIEDYWQEIVTGKLS